MPEQQQNTARKIGPGGFTLIELLVVISIISMLMSILLPSMNLARELGQRVHCAANLRQFTFAWTMYAMNNDDKFCRPSTGWNYSSGNNWVADGPDWPGNNIGNTEEAIKDGALWPYTKTSELYKCKTDRSSRLRSYSIFALMGIPKVNEDCFGHMVTKLGFMNMNQLYRPSERLVFIDVRSRKRWIRGPFSPIISLKTSQWANGAATRHSGGCNLSFADGHCEYWRWRDPDGLEEGASFAAPYEDALRLFNVTKGRKY